MKETIISLALGGLGALFAFAFAVVLATSNQARAGLSLTCPAWANAKCMTLDAAGLLTINRGACGIRNIQVVEAGAAPGTAMPATRQR